MPAYDACPNCGGRKRSKNKQCAGCRGYGTYRHLAPSGYIRVWRPGHPLAKQDGYVLEHRLVVHEAGIAVPDGWHVHHRNGDTADNRLENLEVKPPRAHRIDHIVESGGTVRNQFGTWPLHTPETRRAMWAQKQRELRAKRKGVSHQ
jgi:hypothetical protein